MDGDGDVDVGGGDGDDGRCKTDVGASRRIWGRPRTEGTGRGRPGALPPPRAGWGLLRPLRAQGGRVRIMDTLQHRRHVVIRRVVFERVSATQRRPFVIVHSRGEQAARLLVGRGVSRFCNTRQQVRPSYKRHVHTGLCRVLCESIS
ncbi:Protein of unknown function [Gryllus bimaculatus]|nr:Protein of unknown function [Gryllus bimaculatus]